MLNMLKKWTLPVLIGIVTLLQTSVIYAQAEVMEGVEYRKVPTPETIAPHQKKVVEIFFYGCPHCYNLEPSLHQWLKTKPKDVVFEQMPAVLDNPNWVFMARVFYTAKFLGIEKAFHGRYFAALHRDKRQIYSLDELARFVQPLGIKAEDYKNMFKSFQVSSAISKAKQATQNYGIDGVPAVVVNGKYLTDVPMATSREDLWRLVDILVER